MFFNNTNSNIRRPSSYSEIRLILPDKSDTVAKIPQKLHLTDDFIMLDKTNIIKGRIGSFCRNRAPDFNSFIIINVEYDDDKIKYFDAIFPRMRKCKMLRAESTASSDDINLEFGQELFEFQNIDYKECTCSSGCQGGDGYCSCREGSYNKRSFKDTFIRALPDQTYQLYRFDYEKYRNRSEKVWYVGICGGYTEDLPDDWLPWMKILKVKVDKQPDTSPI